MERKLITPVDKGVQGAGCSLHCAVSMGLGPTGGRTNGIISWQKLKQVQFYSHICP